MPEQLPTPQTAARPDAGAHAEPLPGPADAAAPSPRSVTMSVAVLVTLLLLTVMVFLRVPYAVSSPGPTRDTLGEVDGAPLIEVEDGTPTYPSTGELRLTTVSVVGGPGYPATLPQVVSGWLSGSRTVRPVEAVFAPDITQDQLDEQNQAAMTSSQESATVAALEELDFDVPAELVVAGAVEGTGAMGVVEEDDVVVSFQGEPVDSYTALIDALAQTPPGTDVALGVLRDGERLDLDVVTGERPDGGSQLGVFIDPQFTLPVDVTIRIEDIGGPSAGLMFALGIVDLLTPEDEVAGEVVAGTGTMDVDGTVGPIGGIAQKLAGAERDGADWFLAPAANCPDVVGHVPDGLRVVRVATLAEGRDAIEAIGAGQADTLPTCTAAS
ncbi:PDZ domain-containing protein [uncultured Cellulomonas sp.]|uniref:YlbL family protein n=1 Tax=uncultured Cellulomonas sp. TaxID=189682 RepID=UPI002620B5FA|nr:S16 family serine protease [uncultured Cellulomonas sp.]